MRHTLKRGKDGRLSIDREGRSGGRPSAKVLVMGLAVALVAVAVVGVQTALASGDKNQHTMGEDSYYEENNCNPYDDDDFPGVDMQNRTGV